MYVIVVTVVMQFNIFVVVKLKLIKNKLDFLMSSFYEGF